MKLLFFSVLVSLALLACQRATVEDRANVDVVEETVGLPSGSVTISSVSRSFLGALAVNGNQVVALTYDDINTMPAPRGFRYGTRRGKGAELNCFVREQNGQLRLANSLEPAAGQTYVGFMKLSNTTYVYGYEANNIFRKNPRVVDALFEAFLFIQPIDYGVKGDFCTIGEEDTVRIPLSRLFEFADVETRISGLAAQLKRAAPLEITSFQLVTPTVQTRGIKNVPVVFHFGGRLHFEEHHHILGNFISIAGVSLFNLSSRGRASINTLPMKSIEVPGWSSAVDEEGNVVLRMSVAQQVPLDPIVRSRVDNLLDRLKCEPELKARALSLLTTSDPKLVTNVLLYIDFQSWELKSVAQHTMPRTQYSIFVMDNGPVFTPMVLKDGVLYGAGHIDKARERSPSDLYEYDIFAFRWKIGSSEVQSRTIDLKREDNAETIQLDHDGNLLVGGRTDFEKVNTGSEGHSKAFLLKLAPDLTLLRKWIFAGERTSSVQWIAPAANGNIILGGVTDADNTHSGDADYRETRTSAFISVLESF